MFTRVHHVVKGEKSYDYLKIVESVWQNGRTIQKTWVNLGNLAGWTPEKLEEVARVLAAFLKMDLVELGAVRLGECRVLGPFLPLCHLWERLGMDEILTKALGRRRADSQSLGCAKAMTLMRLVNPCSKKAVWESLSSQVEIPGVDGSALPLHSYYRTLGYLSEAKREIEKSVHARLKNLFSQDVSLVFYDMTSAAFEGTHCRMAKRGYSREHRPDLVQIEVGLLVDAEGIPIGHEVFEGNVKDVTTVLDTLNKLKRDFQIRRCVFVGDDGMASEGNLAELVTHGYEYITSLALRRSPIGKELIRTYPPRRTWKKARENLWIQPLRTQDGVRYIATHNPEQGKAMRRHRRERLRVCISELRRLQAGPKPRGRGRSPEQAFAAADRFLRGKECRHLMGLSRSEDGGLTWELRREALRQEHRMDGVLIIKTNSKTLSDGEVAIGYRTLWRVENAFRHMKDWIRLRPIRHWSDPRVLGHVFICVLAYTLERLYERELENAGLGTARKALEELRPIVTATLKVGDRQLRRRSEMTAGQQKLLAVVGLKDVPEIW